MVARSKLLRISGAVLACGAAISVMAIFLYLLISSANFVFRELSILYVGAETEFKLGLITAVISTAAVVWSVLYQRRRELDALRFERKREAYSGFFDLLFEFIEASDNNADFLQDIEIKSKFRKIMKQMMIWGSPSTVNAFNKFLAESSSPSNDILVNFGRVEQLMRRFRSDLGHHDRSLKKYALTKLIVRGDEHHKFPS